MVTARLRRGRFFRFWFLDVDRYRVPGTGYTSEPETIFAGNTRDEALACVGELNSERASVGLPLIGVDPQTINGST